MIKLRSNAIVESVLLSVTLVLVCYYINNQDPLLLHASFPWVWLLPMLIGLRYGLLGSSITIAIYVFVMYLTVRYRYFDWSSYRVWFLGGLIATIICNEYYAYWHRKQYKIIKKSDYLANRLESLSRAYSAMRISHDRLEESLITKPVTLRGAIADLRTVLTQHHGKLNESSATQLMAILANTSMIGKAGLYLFDKKQLNPEPIGSIGQAEPLVTNDILVTRCLEAHHTFYVAINTLDDNDVSHYLAVVPMMTADNHMLGLLAVKELPFSGMTDESLRIMSLLMAYFADEIYATRESKVITEAYPNCPSFFAAEILRLQHLYKISGIDSTVFTYTFHNNPQGLRLRKAIKQQIRGVDVYWERESDQHLQLLILMPLTLNGMVQAYIGRISSKIKIEFNYSLQDHVSSMKHELISFMPNLNDLIEALKP